jgi:uncharacterized membrane protein YgcG
MKIRKHQSVLVMLASAALFLLLAPAVQAEIMDRFNADIAINEDASVDVTEKIDMDFQGEERHGIKRAIPVRYKRRGMPFSIVFKLQSVKDGANNPLHYVVSEDGADVDIKIGDPDKLATGKQTYVISYRLERAINFISEYPEFYWNATGDEWHFPIRKATVSVKLPKDVDPGEVLLGGYEGPRGSTKPAHNSKWKDHLQFQADSLPPGQNLTIAVKMPIGSIVRPTQMDELLYWIRDWWPAVAIPGVAFAGLYWLWSTTGRDEDGDKPVAVDWNPPKELTPAEVGTLVDEHCDLHDVTSTMVDLAVRGHLKIKELPASAFLFMSSKDYEFTKTDPPTNDTELIAHEIRFLAAMFSSQEAGTVCNLSQLKGSFFPYLSTIKESIYEELLNKKLFRTNPETTRGMYLGYAVVCFIAGVATLFHSIPAGCGTIVASLLIACFAPAMPARTAKGSELTRQTLGFQRFVKMAEKDRIRVLAAEDPTIFGRLLPYAMVLGAADQWAEAFKDIAIEPPNWYYSDSYNGDWSTAMFVNDLGYSLSSFGHAITVPPAGYSGTGLSGGSSAWDGGSAFSDMGGFSGGGFGGGGGSSW